MYMYVKCVAILDFVRTASDSWYMYDVTYVELSSPQ